MYACVWSHSKNYKSILVCIFVCLYILIKRYFEKPPLTLHKYTGYTAHRH